MTSSRIVLAAAVVVTAGLVAVAARGASGAAEVAGVAGNLGIPALWAAVVLTRTRFADAVMAAVATAVVMALLAGGREAAVGTCFLLSGAAGGWAMGRAWRVLPVLALSACWLAPAFFVALGGVDVVAETARLHEEQRRVYAESLAPEMSEADREAALADYDAVAERALAVQRTLWPSLVLVALLVQAAMALGLGWALARLATDRPARPAVRPWETWRAPFFSVWALIAGLALVVSTATPLVTIGWNVVLIGAVLLAVQGLAVQTWLVRRVLPPVTRTLFWIVGALFLAPLLVGGSVLIGLVDQWWELRRERPGSAADDDES